MKSEIKVVITGDVTVDWAIAKYREDEESLSRDKEDRVPVVASLGCASLLGKLVEKALVATSSSINYPEQSKSENFFPGMKGYDHIYTVWSQNQFKKWTIDQFLGSQPSVDKNKDLYNSINKIVPNILVIDDKAHKFRESPELWSESLIEGKPDVIILRKSRPFADASDKLLEKIEKIDSKIVTVITAEDIRIEGGKISKQLSWERTVKDLYHELKNNTRLTELSKSAFTIIYFSPNAAVFLANHGLSSKGWLIFNPMLLEKSLNKEKGGLVHGFTSCIVAAVTSKVVSHLMTKTSSIDIKNIEELEKPILDGIKTGLNWASELGNGYDSISNKGLIFPFDRIINSPKTDTWVDVELPKEDSFDNWSIFLEKHKNKLEEQAKNIVIEGLSSLKKEIPICEFGDLTLIDSKEIESFQNIQKLLVGYNRKTAKRPLSISVFGPPGSGKSFGVKRVAENANIGEIKFLTFNLSQFSSPDGLIGAFHQIRDITLRRELPIVFWDEFDSSPNGQDLGWLPYFLAPMQDGNFQEDQITHFIGPAIFVFAGGTMEAFEELIEKRKKDDPMYEKYKKSKVSDFISRLSGYINILGINPNPSEDEDKLYKIRRAILLNSILKKIYKKIDIDAGVLNALLSISKYEYGARSLETIISMSLLDGSTRFGPSSLPSKDQLSIHVDADKFDELLITKLT